MWLWTWQIVCLLKNETHIYTIFVYFVSSVLIRFECLCPQTAMQSNFWFSLIFAFAFIEDLLKCLFCAHHVVFVVEIVNLFISLIFPLSFHHNDLYDHDHHCRHHQSYYYRGSHHHHHPASAEVCQWKLLTAILWAWSSTTGSSPAVAGLACPETCCSPPWVVTHLPISWWSAGVR